MDIGSEQPTINLLNRLGLLLQEKSLFNEAEEICRRALAIDEQSCGAEHPKVAVSLINLTSLLRATNRMAHAEPPMRRGVEILRMFGEATGHEHPHIQIALRNYKVLLAAMDVSADEIEQQLKGAMETTGPLKPITPEVVVIQSYQLLACRQFSQSVFSWVVVGELIGGIHRGGPPAIGWRSRLVVPFACASG